MPESRGLSVCAIFECEFGTRWLPRAIPSVRRGVLGDRGPYRGGWLEQVGSANGRGGEREAGSHGNESSGVEAGPANR
jgi:hypothetical protein